jgi:hypothetical protein
VPAPPRGDDLSGPADRAVWWLAAPINGTMMPALLNATSSRPKVLTVAFTTAATLSSSDTSQRTPRTRWPAAVNSSAAAPSVVSLIPARTTAAPALANAGHKCNLPAEVIGRVHGADSPPHSFPCLSCCQQGFVAPVRGLVGAGRARLRCWCHRPGLLGRQVGLARGRRRPPRHWR